MCVVNQQIEQRSARRFQIEVIREPFRIGNAVLKSSADQFAITVGTRGMHCPQILRKKRKDMADVKLSASIDGSLEHGLRFLRRKRDRFLAKNVFFSVKC